MQAGEKMGRGGRTGSLRRAREDGAGRSEPLGWADESERSDTSGVSEGTAGELRRGLARLRWVRSSVQLERCKRSGVDGRAGQVGRLVEIGRT